MLTVILNFGVYQADKLHL